ncbi:hypothetical protein [Paenibacillus soyae]|uniref:Uncharacterized protein n=1 Tax=Paenibacillus soyae TaxID=2969249 RepID=A0A9X2MNV1_9BACL|nr:hypothetical protein [Paenibacillus soyae]MCR2803519.1 hypothetical protein [Paenibacillus soyae]
MTKKQILLGILVALAAAAVLDYGFFWVWGMLLLAEPAQFSQGNNTFVIVHYQWNWIQYLLEAVAVFGLFALIVGLRKRRKK